MTKIICKSSKNNVYFNEDDLSNEEENCYLNNFYSINEINNNENNVNNESNNRNNETNNKNHGSILNINSTIKGSKNSEKNLYKISKEINSDIKSRRTVCNNINYSKLTDNNDFEILDNKLFWSNTESNKLIVERNELIKESKDKKHTFHLFGFLKKSKDKKLSKSYDAIRNLKDKKNIKKSMKSKKYKTKDEPILNTIKDIKNDLLSTKPVKQIIDRVKNSLFFYKIVSRREVLNIEENKPKVLRKSNTQDNIFKKTKKGDKKEYFCLLDWEEKDIGNKLLLVSESLINKIQNKELYKAIYLKKNKNKTSPNVMENIDKFNRLSFFIILDILSYDNENDRAKMISKWAKVAEYCKKINNFNDLFAINSALNNYIITGLQLTLKELPKKTLALLKELNKFCDCKGNYKVVRDYISNLKHDEYYLPYLGILLRDLAFYEENSKYIINGVLINFEKIEKVQKILDKFFKFRYLVKKQIEPIPRRLFFFENLENIQEEKLEIMASKLEPLFNFEQKTVKRLTYIDKKYFSNIFK